MRQHCRVLATEAQRSPEALRPRAARRRPNPMSRRANFKGRRRYFQNQPSRATSLSCRVLQCKHLPKILPPYQRFPLTSQPTHDRLMYGNKTRPTHTRKEGNMRSIAQHFTQAAKTPSPRFPQRLGRESPLLLLKFPASSFKSQSPPRFYVGTGLKTVGSMSVQRRLRDVSGPVLCRFGVGFFAPKNFGSTTNIHRTNT